MIHCINNGFLKFIITSFLYMIIAHFKLKKTIPLTFKIKIINDNKKKTIAVQNVSQ